MCYQGPTIVEVTQVSGIEKEVCPEEIPKAPSAWPERQRCIQMEPTSPVCLPT